MKVSRRLGAWMTAVVLAGGVAVGAGHPAAATYPETEFKLTFGSGQTGSDVDTRTNYGHRLPGGPSAPAPAQVVDPGPGHDTIPGTKWIGPDATAQAANDIIYFAVAFEMPSDFNTPDLSVLVHADQAVQVYLNGYDLGAQPPDGGPVNFQAPAEQFSAANPVFFGPGENFLEFAVTNSGGLARFDYQVTVTSQAACVGEVTAAGGQVYVSDRSHHDFDPYTYVYAESNGVPGFQPGGSSPAPFVGRSDPCDVPGQSDTLLTVVDARPPPVPDTPGPGELVPANTCTSEPVFDNGTIFVSNHDGSVWVYAESGISPGLQRGTAAVGGAGRHDGCPHRAHADILLF